MNELVVIAEADFPAMPGRWSGGRLIKDTTGKVSHRAFFFFDGAPTGLPVAATKRVRPFGVTVTAMLKSLGFTRVLRDRNAPQAPTMYQTRRVDNPVPRRIL